MYDKPKFDALNEQFKTLDLNDSFKLLLKSFSGSIRFSSSLGPEDQVITHEIFANNLPIDIFTLDTGRLFNESYELLDKTTRKYKKSIKVFYPINEPLQEFIEDEGINGIYDSIENRKQCCYLRKIEPLNRALKGTNVWVTGLRGTQSQYRAQMNFLEWDEDREMVKFNPLIHYTNDDIWHRINALDIPYNELHKKGFPSIGCQPCTRSIGLHEDERSGRWWWEAADKKECGLHANEIKTKAS